MLYLKYFRPSHIQKATFLTFILLTTKKSGAQKSAPDNIQYRKKDYFQPRAEAPSTAASAPERLD